MKNIPPSVLPHFHDLVIEDLDVFLFEFEFLCRSYNYISDAQKLKLFPSSLEDYSLRWIMGLWKCSILPCEGMKKNFLKMYQEY